MPAARWTFVEAVRATQKEIQIITWEIDSISVLAETHIIQHNIHIAADHLHIAQLPITHSSSIRSSKVVPHLKSVLARFY